MTQLGAQLPKLNPAEGSQSRAEQESCLSSLSSPKSISDNADLGIHWRFKVFPQFSCRFLISQPGKPSPLTCRNSKSDECGAQGSNHALFPAGQPGEFHFLSRSKSQSGPPAHFQHPDASSPSPRGAAGCEQTQSTHTAASWPRRRWFHPGVGWVCARSRAPGTPGHLCRARPLPARLLRERRATQGKNGQPRILITLQMSNALQGERGEKKHQLYSSGMLRWVGGGSRWNRSLTSQAVEIPRVKIGPGKGTGLIQPVPKEMMMFNSLRAQNKPPNFLCPAQLSSNHGPLQ